MLQTLSPLKRRKGDHAPAVEVRGSWVFSWTEPRSTAAEIAWVGYRMLSLGALVSNFRMGDIAMALPMGVVDTPPSGVELARVLN